MFFRKAKRIEVLTEDVSRLERELADGKEIIRIAQAQIKAAEGDFKALNNEFEGLQERHRKVNDAFDIIDAEYTHFSNELVDALGEFTAFQRHIPSMRVTNIKGFRLPISNPFEPYVGTGHAAYEARYANMQVLVASAIEDEVNMRNHIRLVLTDGEGGFGYTMSESQLKEFWASPRNVAQFAKMMISEVSKLAKRKYGEQKRWRP